MMFGHIFQIKNMVKDTLIGGAERPGWLSSTSRSEQFAKAWAFRHFDNTLGE